MKKKETKKITYLEKEGFKRLAKEVPLKSGNGKKPGRLESFPNE